MNFLLELAIDFAGDFLGELSAPQWDKMRSKYQQWKKKKHSNK